MPRATGGIDHPQSRQTEGIFGLFQRVIEDEALDELRGLQQRVAFAHRLGEVLIEIAEETGIPLRIGEVVDDLTGFRIRVAGRNR